MGQGSAHFVAPVLEAVEQLAHRGMIDRPAIGIRHQIALTDIGDVGRIFVFGEQMIKRLIAARTDILGDRLIPFFAIGKDRIDIEHHAAKGEQAVAHHVSDAEAGTGLPRGNNCAPSLT